MKPATGTGQWSDGHETSLAFEDSVEVHMGFVRYEGTELVFEAEVRNTSQRPVLVAPAEFYYQPVATQPVASASQGPTFPGRVAALDPEPRLQQLAQRLSYESEQATKVSFGEVLTSVSHLTENVTSIKKKETNKEIDERAARQQSERNYYTNQRLEHAAAAEQLRGKQQELDQNALRKNTLLPGQRVRGYVYFPRTDMADLLRLVVPLNERPLTFDFNQYRVKQ
ncbi:hypothetical protein HMJ29_00070 [Hymenobacter taeanensis]|uniref:Uncharacterized protein n=1 Tax=Hymenobacter taeanensis TaxID=2735321 RepID=A0A6M6BC65_9BACT|nr:MULTISPECIES: hypothetical protein [Hymenobacter]QJX45414.1 hypothetical protein HMJ29_00070 [Hymenobacter taeanensis]UOQ81343.1 hypothetical protein MUN83_00640 [Hymenobacter sp. 5414T-23]